MAGLLRTLIAEDRRRTREATRRLRELERQQKAYEKMAELERATFEVDLFENLVDRLQSIHKESIDATNWEEISQYPAPHVPEHQRIWEMKAQTELDNYTPGFFAKAFGKAKREQVKLHQNIEKAREQDRLDFQQAMENYQQLTQEWKSNRELAKRVIAHDLSSYIEAIDKLNLFEEISSLGGLIVVKPTNHSLVEAIVEVTDQNTIPTEKKSLLKTGRLSTRPMPKGEYFALYQDYVCGCAIRAARELFASLPIQTVLVNVFTSILNTKTGYTERINILSVVIPRHILKSLNLDYIDTSDSMENFDYRMKFQKTRGFQQVDPMTSVEALG